MAEVSLCRTLGGDNSVYLAIHTDANYRAGLNCASTNTKMTTRCASTLVTYI